MITCIIRAAEALRYYRLSPLPAYLTTRIIGYRLQPTIPSVGSSVTSASLHRSINQYRNINLFSIGDADRLILRVRLTPG